MLRNTFARVRALKAAADYRTQRVLYVDEDRGFVRTAVAGEDALDGRAARVVPPPSGLQRLTGLVRRFASALVHAAMDLVGVFLEWKTKMSPPKAPDFDLHVVGHRGSPAKRVENTIESFDEAVLVDGADVVETDLSVTKDGEVVLWHDWNPDSLISFIRQRGGEADMAYRPRVPPSGHPLRRPVSGLTLEELRREYGYATVARGEPVTASIPTIRDFLEWTTRRPELRAVVLDVKVPAEEVDLVRVLVERFRAAWEATKPSVEVYWLTPQTQVLRALIANVDRGFLSLDVELPGGVVVDFDKYSAVLRAQSYETRFASVGRPQVTVGGWPIYRSIVASDRRRIEHLRKESKPFPTLFCWTINKRSEMKDLVDQGVDGILTDHPARLRDLLASARARAPRLLANDGQVAAPP